MEDHDKSVCAWCVRRSEIGWWGDSDITHCPTCGDTWSSSSAAHCTGCHRLFKSQHACDHHRVSGVCLDPESVIFKGGKRSGQKKLAATVNRYGTTVWTSTVPPDMPQHWVAAK
ncbi:hypothetical protein UFOVP1279_56 [uncultured Caudovirales phage]|uniref:Phage FDXHR zinc binding domain-containing protein n=1 Tax=uncultured Caudovirales phage TaxID=2100421 RepID=A0A6J5RGK2_9CAUD|nr:hypothetical protein UFOVP1279_56 [uncultured Caudovirales phage]